MLVHKGTMGVLDLCWTGRYRKLPGGGQEPVDREFTPEDVEDPEGWWVVPRGSALGRKLRRVYPFCTPVVAQDGSLIDVQAEEKEVEQKARPIKTRQRRRRSGLLEHLFKE